VVTSAGPAPPTLSQVRRLLSAHTVCDFFLPSELMLIDISPLRISRDYRLLFFGQLISSFGTAMSFVVVPVQVYQLTGSTLWLVY
jgi:hypothetical protein